jgi:hypothetical protein
MQNSKKTIGKMQDISKEGARTVFVREPQYAAVVLVYLELCWKMEGCF